MFTDRRVNDEAGPGENYEQHAGYEGLEWGIDNDYSLLSVSHMNIEMSYFPLQVHHKATGSIIS